MSNQPPFDPLDPSDEVTREILAGYRCGHAGKPLPPDASLAFEHGYRNARADRTGIVDDDQRETARRFVEQQRNAQ